MKNLYYILFVTLLISCDSKTNKATLYNNTLLVEQQTIASEMKSYLERLKDTSQTNSLNEFKEALLTSIDNSITTINNLDDFDGDNSFKESVISVLNAYSDGVKTEYEAIANYQRLNDSVKSTDKKRQAEQHAIHADEEITKAEDYFILMQQKFAKENNFNLD